MLKRWVSGLLFCVFLLGLFPAASMASSVLEPLADGVFDAISVLQTLENDADFAGIRVSKDQKHVILRLVNASEARKNAIRAMLRDQSALQFEAAKYTYKELERITLELNAIASSRPDLHMISWGIGSDHVGISVYYDAVERARAEFKTYGDRVRVVGADSIILYGGEYGLEKISDKKWIKSVFPDAKNISVKHERFIRGDAPKAQKTGAVLNGQGETLAIYKFSNKKDYQKAKGMVRGAALVSEKGTAYIDTQLPVSYFYSDDGRAIMLYCGSARAVFDKLRMNGLITLGGFFRARALYSQSGGKAPDENTPASLRAAYSAASHSWCIGTVKRAPGEPNRRGAYEVEISENIKGATSSTVQINAWYGALYEGRRYVFFLAQDGANAWRLADEAYFSAFEVNDKGYVLPIREYGMESAMPLEKFKALLQ